jgi:hypothetical protein
MRYIKKAADKTPDLEPRETVNATCSVNSPEENGHPIFLMELMEHR